MGCGALDTHQLLGVLLVLVGSKLLLHGDNVCLRSLDCFPGSRTALVALCPALGQCVTLPGQLLLLDGSIN